MNQRRKPNRSGKPKGPAAGSGNKPAEMWRPAAALPELEPIVIPHDTAGMLRSMGDPPFGGKSVLTGHYLMSVVDRAAVIATALAASADLLGTDD
jgi:hypothetical protein